MFQLIQQENISYLKSDLFDDKKIVHAFSTRIGGNTPSPLKSFSMGTGGFKEFETMVKNNREKFCSMLGLDNENLIIPEQKHTDNIKIVSSSADNVLNTDGLITATKGLGLMLLFADCVPVILYSPEKHVLGVIHAGWRGTAKGIVRKAIDIFENKFNAQRSYIRALIGPAIGQCCYPVSQEVSDKLKSSLNNTYDNVFNYDNQSGNINVDLKLINFYQLQEAGVINIDNVGYCTSCENSLFYSYRAEQGQTGRHCAIASLK